MRRSSFEDMHCSIARALEVVGEWWTLLILRDCFLDVSRFEDFQQRLGIARNVLTTRLDTLVDHGVLERRPYDEPRGRYDYVLTDKGRSLWPVMVTLRQWGDEWIVGEARAPMALRHETCGELTHGVLHCDRCGQALVSGEMRPVPGPGRDPDGLAPPARHRR